MKIAAIVFGLLIPVYAYHTAYPGGPQEMYNKIKYGWVDNLPEDTQVFRLPLAFADETKSTYDYVNTQLGIAKDTDIAVIAVEDNRGGAATMLQAAEKAMLSSQATVITTVKHIGLSCGTFILGYGDYLKLPYDSVLLFHTGSVAGTVVTEAYPSWLPEHLRPTWDAFYRDSIKTMKPYKSWISEGDYEQYKLGKDLFYTGRDLCLKLRGTNAPVLYQTNSGCVIKGFKPPKLSWLTKFMITRHMGF